MGYNISEFKVFICYREDVNGSLYAELTKLILSKGNVNSFVAHIERRKHAEDFDKMRQELLQIYLFAYFCIKVYYIREKFSYLVWGPSEVCFAIRQYS